MEWGDRPLLTEEMLDALAERRVSVGARIVESLRPGLPDAELDALTEPLGLRLPAEARTWWGWRDGTNSLTGDHAIGLDLLYLPIQHSLDAYRTQRRIAAQVAEGDDVLTPDDVWPRSWLPLSVKGNGALVACEIEVPEGAPSPIQLFHHEFGDTSRTPDAGSLGTVVSWWISAIDSGAWAYDRGRGVWEQHPERLSDARLARTWLV